MNEITWIKIVTSLFDDTKIKIIDAMPKGDSILIIWFKLLCLCGKTNKDGLLMITDSKPHDIESLASNFHRTKAQVEKAMNVFNELEMVEIIDGAYYIKNWGKYQTVDKMKEIREYNRVKQQEYRARIKAEKNQDVIDSSLTGQIHKARNVNDCQDIEEEEDNKNKNKNPLIINQRRQMPTMEEIKEFIKKHKLLVNAENFYGVQELTGWSKPWQKEIVLWNNGIIEEQKRKGEKK